MPTWYFCGDILRAARVSIEANTVEEAIARVSEGEFDEIWDEAPCADYFSWSGDPPEDEDRNEVEV